MVAWSSYYFFFGQCWNGILSIEIVEKVKKTKISEEKASVMFLKCFLLTQGILRGF